MDNEYKQQSPYRGMWVVLLLLIVPPIVFYALVSGVMEKYSHYSDALDSASARAFGCGVGTLFHLSCIISGVLTPGWRALKYRIGEFFENLVGGLGFALSSYWDDMRTDGVTFIIYMPIIVVNAVIAVDGILDAIALLPK